MSQRLWLARSGGAKRGVALALLASVSTLTASSKAEPSPPPARGVHLSWTRSPTALSCPDAGRVQADVVRRLGRSPFVEPSRVFIEATITNEAGTWRAELEMRDEAGVSLGSREVESDSHQCGSLASAAGLAIALMIDPDALLERPTPTAAPRPAPVPVAAPAAPTPAPPTPPRAELLASAIAASRVLPKPAIGARLAGDVRLLGRFEATLSLAFLPERRAQQNGEEVSFGLLWGALGPCYRLVDSSRVKLAACATFAFGALQSVVFEPGRTRTSQLPWAAATAGLRVGVSPTHPLVLEGGVDLLTPLYRRDYLVEHAPGDNVLVFSDPSVAGMGFIGVGVQY